MIKVFWGPHGPYKSVRGLNFKKKKVILSHPSIPFIYTIYVRSRGAGNKWTWVSTLQKAQKAQMAGPCYHLAKSWKGANCRTLLSLSKRLKRHKWQTPDATWQNFHVQYLLFAKGPKSTNCRSLFPLDKRLKRHKLQDPIATWQTVQKAQMPRPCSHLTKGAKSTNCRTPNCNLAKSWKKLNLRDTVDRNDIANALKYHLQKVKWCGGKVLDIPPFWTIQPNYSPRITLNRM